jgi:hypothetical protein
LYFHIVDTTLVKKGVYLYFVEAMRNGKKVKSETTMAHNLGLLDKPRFIHFTAEPLKDRKAVRLEWQLNYTETIKTISLYRSNKYKDGYVKITDISPQENTYTDNIPLANEPWFYFVEINNFFGGKRQSVRISAFATFAEKPFPPQDVDVEPLNDSIVFNWRNVGNNIVGYRVYRSLDKKPFEQLNEMEQSTAKNIYFVDKDKMLKKAINIQYFIRNVSDGFVESNVTDTIHFYMPEHKLVYPPSQIDKVINSKGQVKLLWVPDKRGAITGYNIYLKNSKGKISKLNKEIWLQNYYTEEVYRPAGKYEYQIEGVSYDKISDKRTIINVYFDKPIINMILDLKKVKSGLEVSWKKTFNPAAKKLMLYKVIDNGKGILIKTYDARKDGKYLDKYVRSGKHYAYFMKAILQDAEKVKLDNQVEIVY